MTLIKAIARNVDFPQQYLFSTDREGYGVVVDIIEQVQYFPLPIGSILSRGDSWEDTDPGAVPVEVARRYVVRGGKKT